MYTHVTKQIFLQFSLLHQLRFEGLQLLLLAVHLCRHAGCVYER